MITRACLRSAATIIMVPASPGTEEWTPDLEAREEHRAAGEHERFPRAGRTPANLLAAALLAACRGRYAV